MTREARASTPVPEEAAESADAIPIRKRIEHAKYYIGLAVSLLVAGFGFAMWAAGWATKADVEKVRAGAAAEFEQVRNQTMDLRLRMPVVEAAATDLKADTTIIRAQLFEIAKAVGARQVQPAVTPPVQETTP